MASEAKRLSDLKVRVAMVVGIGFGVLLHVVGQSAWLDGAFIVCAFVGSFARYYWESRVVVAEPTEEAEG